MKPNNNNKPGNIFGAIVIWTVLIGMALMPIVLAIYIWTELDAGAGFLTLLLFGIPSAVFFVKLRSLFK